jgi:hypothetical protein
LFVTSTPDEREGENIVAQYEVAVSKIEFDFSTNLNEISSKQRSDLISHVLSRKWILGVEAEKTLTGPSCQKISNETGCLVRDVKYTATKVG